jgi:hypothetical protein
VLGRARQDEEKKTSFIQPAFMDYWGSAQHAIVVASRRQHMSTTNAITSRKTAASQQFLSTLLPQSFNERRWTCQSSHWANDQTAICIRLDSS